MTRTMKEPVIVDAVRTPVGRRGGALAAWHPADLMGATIAALVDRTGIDPAGIDDVIVGAVLQHDQQSGNLGRHAVLAAGLPETVPAMTVDRQCGSGQQAVDLAAHAIAAGAQQVVIAGGVESMSQVALPPSLVPGAALGPQYSPRELARYSGALTAQGPSSEMMNTRFGLTRAALDEFSARSHARAHAAWQEGRFADHLVALTGDPADPDSAAVTADEGVRATVDRARMAELATPFAADGATTAANASQLSDGAAALLLVERGYAEAHGLTPIARVVTGAVAAADPIIQFTAILEATRKALARAGLSLDQIDLFEVNEAFACVAMAPMKDLGIPHQKLNVNGGACALGHPIGASGARLVVTLLHALKARNLKRGVASLCIGGGEATAIAIELC